MAYNYTSAFVAFCKGAPAEEISIELNIPIGSLKSKMRQEGWKSLADSLLGQNGPVPGNAGEALARIEANRAKNFEAAAKLRDELGKIIDQLLAGTLRIQKRFHYKGGIVECEAQPSLADLVQLATYARMVHDMTYRALGDIGANGGHKADVTAGTQPPACPITIVLPEAISMPRTERAARAKERLLAAQNGTAPAADG